MELPPVLSKHLPSSWMDETFLRQEIISACNDHLDDMTAVVAMQGIDYLGDDERLSDVLVEYLPVAEMTEDEFAYVVQLVITKCMLNDLENRGYATEVEPGKWKFEFPGD